MKGRELLPVAKKLGAGQAPKEPAARSAVNRAYYAAYTEVTEYVTHRGLPNSPSAYSHNRTWNYLKNGIADIDARRRAERRALADQGFLLKARRQKADYEPNAKLARDESKSAIAEAQTIIKRLDALKP
jgi:uncharacterized protein (UPF0332 family)